MTVSPISEIPAAIGRGSADDFAFLRVEGLGFCIGRGPFLELPAAPDDGRPCFYANDFLLEDPAPWKVPKEFWIGSDLSGLARGIGDALPEIGWDPPGQRQWESLCKNIRQDLERGRYSKIVPVVTEIGRLLGGSLDALVHGLPGLPAVYGSYGYRVGSRGLVGATQKNCFPYVETNWRPWPWRGRHR